MTAPAFTVGRGVITEMVRMAAYGVPGVLRVGRRGPAWRSWLAGEPVAVMVREGAVNVRVHVIARPGVSLVTLGAAVRSAVAATIERLLGLQPGRVSVVVDGVGD